MSIIARSTPIGNDRENRKTMIIIIIKNK